MATTIQPATGETTKQLVNYHTDGGVAVIEMCDPPANTYTYEMNRQLQSGSRMSIADWDVLTALGASESASLTVTTLAAQIGWERSRLSHHVKRMASRGLVELVTADSDRRATQVHLTADGADVHAAPQLGADLAEQVHLDRRVD